MNRRKVATSKRPNSRVATRRWAHGLTLRRIGAFTLFIVTLGTFIALLADAHAQQVRPAPRQVDEPLVRERLALLKAGAVRHLPGHTEWPENRSNDDEERREPIIITVVGRDGFGFERYLERVATGQRAHGRPLLVRLLEYPRPRPGDAEPHPEDLENFRRLLRESHVLYIGVTEETGDRYRRTLQYVRGHGVLTVSFIDNFAHRGGMIRFTVRENRLAMDANLNRIREADLKVSSSLLRLARIVTSPEGNQHPEMRD